MSTFHQAHQTPILHMERRFIMHIKKNPSADVLILGNEEHMRDRNQNDLLFIEIAKLFLYRESCNCELVNCFPQGPPEASVPQGSLLNI